MDVAGVKLATAEAARRLRLVTAELAAVERDCAEAAEAALNAAADAPAREVTASVAALRKCRDDAKYAAQAVGNAAVAAEEYGARI